MRVFKGKKGALFFTIDTIIASLIVTLTIIIVVSFYTNKPVTEDSKLVLDNFATYITSTTIRQISTQSNFIYFDPNETEQDLYVYQKISSLVHSGNTLIAAGLAQNITNVALPAHYGIAYSIDNTTIYQRQSIDDAGTTTNLTTRILTIYLNASGELIGPNSTKISVWI